MAFGHQSGPPASHHQLRTLTELVRAAGHRDLRDARGPLGLTQRQAGGRFTRDEADALIARLEAESAMAEGAEAAQGAAEPAPPAVPGGDLRRRARVVNGLHEVPAEVLAAELQRRGWVVMEP